MNPYVLSPRAHADLHEIWDYTQVRWSGAQAEAYIRNIQGAIEAVAANPQRGRRCDEIRAGYMKFSVGAHVLFYRVSAGRLDVVRILHQRMDFGSRL
ncbi:type II toxin-antitoxin system RelE/ParE family toxin [Labrys monachus]|uniref:type II toxin-antitoxin system RelE/ParE family toxin n=1 Tax=Labrys monachus TaxID=217067 RepID=UPI0027D9280C|nr:type II toxin-antitoxin system RelE/ParE family toxin [Labrys monachus]